MNYYARGRSIMLQKETPKAPISTTIASIIAIIVNFFIKIFPQLISSLMLAIKAILAGSGANNGTGDPTFDKAIDICGYAYDPNQDIFYSKMDAWQRDFGYCRLYDETASPMGMVIDCEPIYFVYSGKRWLIEMWKGQYDLTTGGEVGVYTTEGPDLNIENVFNGTFYNCASSADMLNMSYSLKKNDEILFTRKDKHWWLTGFKLGEFAQPSELSMDIDITLKDQEMCTIFVKALEEIGYTEDEMVTNSNTVSIKFVHPHTAQPVTRTPETDSIIQSKNELLCDKYQEITKPYTNFPDKIKAIEEQSPDIYDKMVSIGKPKQLYERYDTIQKYLNNK